MDIKTNALLAEIELQRNFAFTRCASLAAELAEAFKKIEQLEAENARSHDTPSR